jgi:hypothetical protein
MVDLPPVGIFRRGFFDGEKDYFKEITEKHEFQSLSLSDKNGQAYRTGIYLSAVTECDEGLKFKLLRCSTNLSGPTDNFRTVDEEIVQKANTLRVEHYPDAARLNHVLAQVYHNVVDANSRERKAKISRHSDKTKDMPSNGLIAFCSFYQGYGDTGDHLYKGISVLTQLKFRLKDCVKDDTLSKEFTVTLYPNSIYLIDLHVNRLYTHEIVPSTLPIDKIPVRMGYIIRCSNTDALFKDGQTYIVRGGKNVALEPSNAPGLGSLKELYWEENATAERVAYDDVPFSMNSGDYMKPLA